MQPENWGDLSGSIYCGSLFLREKCLWSGPRNAPRSALRPIVKFRTKQTSRWNVHYAAFSSDGEFSFQVEADNPPVVGTPDFRGALQIEGRNVADIICRCRSSQFLFIGSKSPLFQLTAEKALPKSSGSDVVFVEDSTGELATIPRYNLDKAFKEQAIELFGLRPSRRGMFSDTSPLPALVQPIRQFVLAALCIYFYQLERLYNSDGSFG